MRRLIADGAALLHCYGTDADHARLRRGDHSGWRIAGRPSAGDVLVGLVGPPWYVIDLTPVFDVTGPDGCCAVVDPQEELRLDWPVALAQVTARLGAGHAPSSRVMRGSRAVAFGEALAQEILDVSVVDDDEGERRAGACRRRSRANRKTVLRREDGTCQSCGFAPRAVFGDDGDGALDVHHRFPLSAVDVRVRTSTRDLILLCATCHRLTHRRADLDWEAVRAAMKAVRGRR